MKPIDLEERFLRIPQVIALTGIGKSTIYAYIQTGAFPRPIRIGARLSVWRRSDVADWMRAQITSASEGAPQQGGGKRTAGSFSVRSQKDPRPERSR